MGGYKDLIKYPAAKSVDSNDWMENDGVEADLSSLYFQPASFTLPFWFMDDTRIAEFVDYLRSQSAIHSALTLNVAELGYTLSARCLGVASLDKGSEGLSQLSVKFVVDNPMASSVTVPSSTILADNTLLIDGVASTDYNVRLLKGSLSSVLNAGEWKSNLLVSSKYGNGQRYEAGGTPKVMGRNITIQCLMVADSLTDFFAFYRGLFYDITKSDSVRRLEDETTAHRRTLTIMGIAYECYYKSQSIADFFPTGDKVWCRFSLTFGVVAPEDKFLITEDGDFIITELGMLINVA